MAKVKGARILVVEDNDINQQIACELLQDAGLVVKVAANGRIALDMLAKDPFELVLMDMQMPVMDGIEATIAIRRQERFQSLPIVAMTANAMVQDRQKCLDAGMNDYLGKPIDVENLWRVLLKWIKLRASDLPTAVPTHPTSAPALLAVPGLPAGVPGLDVAAGLARMMGKKPLYLAMLRKYVTNHKRSAQDIQQALDAGDWATAERLAHTLKGVSATVGAIQLPELSLQLEQAIKDKAMPEIARLIGSLDAALGAQMTALGQQLPAETTTA
jgi:CheY-like chemotaxis protein